VAEILTQKAVDVANQQEELGLPACLLVPDAIRNSRSLLRRVAPRLQVLAHSEIPEPTPSASARFLKVQPHEYQTLLRPDRPRGPGQGAHGFWRRHPDSLQPPDAGWRGSHGHGEETLQDMDAGMQTGSPLQKAWSAAQATKA
jgi:hypothetical protein